MNKLLSKIKNSQFISSIERCEEQITPILQNFITNFRDYTDHSIVHSKSVLRYAEHLLSDEIHNLNEDEIYILLMGGFLHDIGMCPTPAMKELIIRSNDYKNSEKSFENHLRDIHHTVSYKYIIENWRELHIINEIYAEAIALTAMGHREVDLRDFEVYNPNYIVKTGEDFVSLPYLACILRVADELDITNDRTPDLLYNKYLPDNKISQQEWNKHRANYFVSFTKPAIKLVSKCSDKDLYYALIKQYSKIDSVIKYAQRVITALPYNNRRFTLEYNKLDYEIKPLGFIPKSIGFTFDLQNTINTFIGENIYKNRYVAIRECVQNAIDSCKFRKESSEVFYKPEITVTLTEKQLIISDNGNGMDEFIVLNYFSKLAKSYYSEARIAERYESIGQFGIGVFSYFLLCDSFIVISKTEKKEKLKFLVTRDAENYFYFFDEQETTTTGTQIAMNLKEELDLDELHGQLKYYFRFVEVPIRIKYNDYTVDLDSDTFDLNTSEFLRDDIHRDYHDKLANLELIESHIKHPNFEGVLGMVFKRTADGILDTFELYKELSSTNISRIEVSQKGIFLDNTRDHNFETLIGKINLSRKNQIDLGRYKVRDREHINEAIEIILSDILRLMFENWTGQSPKVKSQLFKRFLANCVGWHEEMNYKPFYKFYDQMYFRVYINNLSEFQYLSLAEVRELGDILIMHKDTPFEKEGLTDNNIQKMSNRYESSVICHSEGKSMSFVYNLVKNQGYNIKVVSGDNNWYYHIEWTNLSHERPIIEMKRRGDHDAFNFDSSHICAFTGLYLEVVFNREHEVVRYYLENKAAIKRSLKSKLAFADFFHEVRQFFYGFHQFSSGRLKDVKASFSYLNISLGKVNDINGTAFKLSNEDFPAWMIDTIKIVE